MMRRLLVAAALSCLATPAAAQETRAEERARQQEQKQLTPDLPSRSERFFDWLEDYLVSPSRWYATFGTVMPSSGLGPGAGYRGVLRDAARFNVRGAWSVRNYAFAEGVLEVPLADERIRIGGHAQWRRGSQLPFYGVGGGSSRDERTSYGLETVDLGLVAAVRPSPWLRIEAGTSLLLVESGRGTGRHPSIETVFDDEDTPSLLADPDYLHSDVTVAVDWRQSEGYTRRGGYYAVTLHRYDDRSGGQYSFNLVEADAQQFIPLLNEHWVVALRGRVWTTSVANDRQVPFFLLPALGGSTSLRGYPDGRFRDHHALLATAEYRWTPGPMLDMALFVDTGNVEAHRRDLGAARLRTSYGVGARFHSPAATVLRIEAARGGEGFRFHVAFGQHF
jgi:hypothetical protein